MQNVILLSVVAPSRLPDDVSLLALIDRGLGDVHTDGALQLPLQLSKLLRPRGRQLRVDVRVRRRRRYRRRLVSTLSNCFLRRR